VTTQKSTDPPVVLLGASLNSLWAARTFARAGVHVYVLADGLPPPQLALYSRHAEVGVDITDRSLIEARWTPWLERLPPPAVLIPCMDDGVEYLAGHRQHLVALGHLPAEAADEVSLTMLDKQATYELAASLGVEVPWTALVGSVRELRNAAARIGYPCALKPVWSHHFAPWFHVKAIVARDWAELEQGLHRTQVSGLELLLTEIIPGTDDAYCSYFAYMDQAGRPLIQLTKHKLRQWPVGFGMGSLHVTGWVPDAADAGLKLFRGIGLRGVGNVEFKRDSRDGRLKLIECNPRLTNSDHLLRRAGVDLARIAYERALGRTPTLPSTYTPGLRQWHVADDILASLALRREGRLSAWGWLGSVARPETRVPVLDLRDPMPSVIGAGYFARRAVRRARRGRAPRIPNESAEPVADLPAPVATRSQHAAEGQARSSEAPGAERP
jgi:predicted ATP-grasp superfamily ATP-dependent carboligase